MNIKNSGVGSTVLVLGANGRLGQSACESFAAAGWRVLAHSRRDLHWLGANEPGLIRQISGKVDQLGLTDSQSGPVSVVVNALNPIYTRWQTEALPLARQAMDLAQRMGATLLFPGNVYNFGASMPELLTEETPQVAQTKKGKIRIQIELELRARAKQGLQTIIVRAGDFFGVGSGTWLDLVITKDLHKARLTYPGNPDLVHAWAYLPDLTRAFVDLAEKRQQLSGFEVFHFEGYSLTGNELLSSIECAARSIGLINQGQHLSVRQLPWWIMKIAAIVAPMMRELVEMKYLWDVPHRLDDTRLRGTLGQETISGSRTPLPQAIERTLQRSSTHQASRPALHEAIQ